MKKIYFVISFLLCMAVCFGVAVNAKKADDDFFKKDFEKMVITDEKVMQDANDTITAYGCVSGNEWLETIKIVVIFEDLKGNELQKAYTILDIGAYEFERFKISFKPSFKAQDVNIRFALEHLGGGKFGTR